MTISWYPGHMHKANKEMAAIIKDIDVVVEVLDARMPQASSNPMLSAMRQGKPCLRILNKADLADPHITKRWLAHFSNDPLSFAATSSKEKRINSADVIFLCQKLMRKANAGKPVVQAVPSSNPDLEALKEWKRQQKKHQIMIVGIPNVGKSSIMNQILGKHVAKTGNEPAITKGQQRVRLNDHWYLVDTPGVLWPKLEDQAAAYRLAMSGAIRNTAIEFVEVAIFAAQTLVTLFPERVKKRYQMEELPEGGEAFLEALARAKGCVRKASRVGASPARDDDAEKHHLPDIDWQKVSEMLINDYRAGRFGPMSLEIPPV
ncbi:MAG: hypothetical protein A3H44_04625 [Gammaproteobacteria bacterium RIFCSPLOWO2_02_FULL_57_10]|nr:MAG: hypothetical protein A3H44_04625 [Gammaproteobacteria bacterium RIFCSPLOWO2_02_FULL_57_10]